MNNLNINRAIIAFWVLLACFTYPLYSQSIQRTVIGLSLGRTYSHNDLTAIMGQRNNSYGTYKTEGVGKASMKSYSFSSVFFGGYEWDCVRLDLNYQNQLFNIELSHHFDNYNDALNRRDNLLRALKSKYGEPYLPDEKTHHWSDSQSDVSLGLKRMQAMNNHYYYYVFLMYDDATILKRVASAMDDEL